MSSKAVLSFDTAIIGASLDSTILITNNLFKTVKVTANLFDTTIFRVSPSSFALAGRSSISLRIRYAPDTGFRHTAILRLTTTDTTGCNFDSVNLIGQAISPSSNRVAITLGSANPSVIAMASSSQTTIDTLYLTNNSAIADTIIGLNMAGSNSPFSVLNLGTLPKTIPPTGIDTVVLTYNSASAGRQERDALVIATHGTIATEEHTVYGLQYSAVRAVQPTLPPIALSIELNPNPTHGALNVSVHGLRRGTVELIDILGRTVTSAPITDHWNWKASSATVHPNGVYIVRITGLDESGRVAVGSKRFVLER